MIEIYVLEMAKAEAKIESLKAELAEEKQDRAHLICWQDAMIKRIRQALRLPGDEDDGVTAHIIEDRMQELDEARAEILRLHHEMKDMEFTENEFLLMRGRAEKAEAKCEKLRQVALRYYDCDYLATKEDEELTKEIGVQP